MGAHTGRANICQVTTPCVCDVLGTVLQKASGILPRSVFPCLFRTAPLAHYDRQACSVCTKPATPEDPSRRTVRRIVHVHGNQSGDGAKRREEAAGAARAKPTATGSAARANLRRRDHSAALRE